MQHSSYLRAAIIFALCLLSVVLWPLLSFSLSFYCHSILPDSASPVLTWLFCSADTLFPYAHLLAGSPNYSHLVFSPAIGWTLTLVQWALIFTVFSWLARKLSFGYTVLAAISTIILTGIATEKLLYALGFIVCSTLL
jgi:hypothetical protein